MSTTVLEPVKNNVTRDIGEIQTDFYLQYSYSVLLGRAIAAVEDGLKPVHRRVIYGMSEMNAIHSKPFRKNGLIVGIVLGHYHPKGDTAVYDSLIGLGQPWSMRSPLVTIQGNKGNISGDGSAAMRYTEGRLSKLAGSMTTDLRYKGSVQWMDNYNKELQEPVFLPVPFPNILLNGTSGIAVGYSADIPPHNPVEIMNAVEYLVSTSQADFSFKEFSDLIPGPDFPTGGTVCNASTIPGIYNRGHGIITLRCKYEINEKENYIKITELPFMVKSENLINSLIEELVEKKTALHLHVRDASDYSNRRDNPDSTDVDIRIFGRKKADLNYVLQLLLVNQNLTRSIKCNFNVLVGGDLAPNSSVESILRNWIDFRKRTIRKRTSIQFTECQNSIHIYEGFLTVIGDSKTLDNTIGIIRSSSNKVDANSRLREEIGLTVLQAAAVLDLTLSRLTKIGRGDIEGRLVEQNTLKAKLIGILTSESLVSELLISEMRAAISTIPAALQRRKTVLTDIDTGSNDIIIEPGQSQITFSANGVIRRINLDGLKKQGRGGKGRVGVKLRKNDSLFATLNCNNEDTLFILTNRGRCFQLISGSIPESDIGAVGHHLSNFIEFAEKEEAIKVIPVSSEQMRTPQGLFLNIITDNGKFKKTGLEEYIGSRRNGIIAIELEENGTIIDACLATDTDSMMLLTGLGHCIHFEMNTVRPISRTSKGRIGGELRSKDGFIGMARINSDQSEVVTVTDAGQMKKVHASRFPLNSIGTKGYKVIPNNSILQCVFTLDKESEQDCILTTSNGKVIRFASSEIKATISRSALGVKAVDLDEGDLVLAVCLSD